MATRKKSPIDQPVGSRYVLDGCIVTMNGAFKVIDRGHIYLVDGVISAVRDADATPPAGFDAAPVIMTGGIIFPDSSNCTIT